MGYIVLGEGIRSDPEKVEAMKQMAPTTTVIGVTSFIGMTRFYRQCMPNYSDIAQPLTALAKKNMSFDWGLVQQAAWDKLRDAFASDQVMVHPQLIDPYKLYTDASDYAVGAVLVLEDDEGIERPIQYVSKQLTGPQLKRSVIEREAFPIIHALKKLRLYLYSINFNIIVDHKPLKSLLLSEIKNTHIQNLV